MAAEGRSSVPRFSRAAEIFSCCGLAGDGAENWLSVYEHTGNVVAAATAIMRQMGLAGEAARKVRAAALLHDATKRLDVERHGPFANSLENTDQMLQVRMRDAGYPEDVIMATVNTGRADRRFDSVGSRHRSIEAKGIMAAIVGLADARCTADGFISLGFALKTYYARKTDPESMEFFAKHWLAYYLAVERYLAEHFPRLRLDITNEDIYNQVIFPEVLGSWPSENIRATYSYVPQSDDTG